MEIDVEPCGGLTAVERRRGLSFLGLTVAAVGFAMAVQMGLNANFLAEEIGVTGAQLGLLEAVRESCGIAAVAFLALLAGLSEPVVGSAMLVLFALGLGGYTFTHRFVSVVAVSVVWSQGLHVWMPLPGSMAMGLAEPGRAGHRLGQMRAAGSAGFGGGLVAAYAMNHAAAVSMPLVGGFLWEWADYRWPFAIGAAAALLSILVAARLPPHSARAADE